MPDITMCNNGTCPFRKECYRYQAVPHPIYQSWNRFYPDTKPHEELGELDCDARVDIPEGRKITNRK